MSAHVRPLMRDQGGNTALMLAASFGASECLAALVAVDGMDVNVQGKVRHTVYNHTCHAVHCVHARPASCRGPRVKPMLLAKCAS